ncbi:hypothetical protein ccbrp13_08500 [Ktedonobacteria bacterium brp13]|nr:hypothetical protein ccbrp13_08500 [Ktedonobacteria bacterium brp13]
MLAEERKERKERKERRGRAIDIGHVYSESIRVYYAEENTPLQKGTGQEGQNFHDALPY